MIGDRAFAFALLRHGIFDFSDLRKCAQALRQGASADGGISQSAGHVPDPELRSAALKARQEEKYAKRIASWADSGWVLNSFQKEQLILLETGELAKRVRAANAAYGFGRGAEKALTAKKQ